MNKYMYLIFALTLFTGCLTTNDSKQDWSDHALPNQLSERSDDVGEASKSVIEVASKQTDINNIIGKETTDIKNASGTKYDKNTGKIYGQIKSSNQLVTRLVEVSGELNATKEGLVLAEKSASDMRDSNASLTKDNKRLSADNLALDTKLKASTKKFLNKVLGLLVALGIIAVGISGYVAWGALQLGQSPLKAGGIAIAGVSITTCSVGYMYHSVTIGWIVLIVIVVALGSLLYKLWSDCKDRKSLKDDIDLKDRTIDYATQLTEQLKDEVLTTEEKKVWFGTKHSDGKAGLLQRDERIKQVVQSTRKRINGIDSTTVV